MDIFGGLTKTSTLGSAPAVPALPRSIKRWGRDVYERHPSSAPLRTDHGIPFAKRLQRLEEQMASRLNQPLAYLWLLDGETNEECCIRHDVDPAQANRCMFIRWLTPEEVGQAEPPPWDEPNPGPPKDDPGPPAEAEQDRRAALAGTVDTTPDALGAPLLDPLEEDIDRRAARRLQNERIHEAGKRFGKTIV